MSQALIGDLWTGQGERLQSRKPANSGEDAIIGRAGSKLQRPQAREPRKMSDERLSRRPRMRRIDLRTTQLDHAMKIRQPADRQKIAMDAGRGFAVPFAAAELIVPAQLAPGSLKGVNGLLSPPGRNDIQAQHKRQQRATNRQRANAIANAPRPQEFGEGPGEKPRRGHGTSVD